MGNFFVFFLHLSASTFHCFFIACIIYNFVILCSLVAFHPGNILDICGWILFLRGLVSLNADNDAIILYWHLLHSSLSGGKQVLELYTGRKVMCKWDDSRGRYPKYPLVATCGLFQGVPTIDLKQLIPFYWLCC